MNEYLDWKVVNRVECIDVKIYESDKQGVRFAGGLDGLDINKIYTIRDIFIHPIIHKVCLKLNEIYRSDKYSQGFETGYLISRFRKIIDRPTDISIFEKMLTKTPEQNNKELVESELEELVNV